MAFADLNNDKYTDVVTIGDSKSSFTAHIYDSAKKMFAYQKTVKPNSVCQQITNIAVGRSIDRIRLFVTCANPASQQTVLKIFDKSPNSLDF